MSDHKLVLKNTMMLYLRMLVTLAISLFTTRIVFNALGLSDLGIYNVVGGVLSLLGILNNTMAGSAQRFISFDLGRKDVDRLKQTFGTLLTTQVILAIGIVLLAETIGLWFVNNKLVIPADKMVAANWIYQTAIISMVLGIIKSPFTASVIAYERMSIYAYFTIVDVVIKLLIVVALLYIPDNRLIIYALLLLLSAIIDFLITVIYCLKKLKGCSFRLSYNKSRFKEIFSYSGWTLIGQSTIIANEQVVNIFLNWFFGPIANGAKSIADRVKGMVAQFVYQFQTAVSPPIIKSYAAGDYQDMRFLLFMGCKISFILIFILSFPLIMEAPFIFQIWVGSVPEYTVWFLRLILLNTLIDSMTGPVSKSIQATGKIKKEQVQVSLILFSIIPCSYLLLYFGLPPYSVFLINILTGLVTIFVRVHILSNLIPLSLKQFTKEAFIPCFLGSVVAFTIILLIKLAQQNVNFWISCFNCILCVLIACISFYYLALNKSEQQYAIKLFQKVLKIKRSK